MFCRDMLTGSLNICLEWEAKVLVERWRREYKTLRPHSYLGYVPPRQRRLKSCCTAPGLRPYTLRQASRD
ncbi:MAG: integrase core domain-containing protein [Planctomycetota bacterium]